MIFVGGKNVTLNSGAEDMKPFNIFSVTCEAERLYEAYEAVEVARKVVREAERVLAERLEAYDLVLHGLYDIFMTGDTRSPHERAEASKGEK